MKYLRFALLILAASCSADITPPIRWDVETGRLEPKPYPLSIRRGESITIEPRYMSYTTAIDLTGATVEMRYSSAYNSASYYSATGVLLAETGRVQIAWSDSLNPTNSAMVYEIRATLGTNILARSYGPLMFLGGMVGINTGLTARTSLDWVTISQQNGYAVLSNQMGIGATWSGSNWSFAAGADDLGWTTNRAPVTWVSGFSNCPALWDADYQTVKLVNPDGTTLQLGQEISPYVRNVSGTFISNGMAVRSAGASGWYSGCVLLSNTDTWTEVIGTIGLATTDIAPNQLGKVTIIGDINEVNTTALIESSNVWSGVDYGSLTMIEPSDPASKKILLGKCTRSHATQGRIEVTVHVIPRPVDIGAATSAQGALADTALQAEVDTLYTASARGRLLSSESVDGLPTALIVPGAGAASSVLQFYGSLSTNYFYMEDNGIPSWSGSPFILYGSSGSSLTDITAAQVGALPIGGGTVTGSVYSTIDHTTMSPADNEVPTAGWVRDLFPVDATYYSTSNDNSVVTNLGFTCRTLSLEIPQQSSGVFTNGLTNSAYIGSIATTNKISINGNVVINTYISAIGNNPSPSLTLHPEIYGSADGSTLYGDWEVQNQTITLGGTTNLYTFIIPIGSVTNSYVIRRWKIGSANNITSIRFHNGTNGTDTASKMGVTLSAGTSVETDPVYGAALAAGTIVTNGGAMVNGQPITNGAAITISASVTNGYFDLLPVVASTTCTLQCAYGQRIRIQPTGTVYFVAGSCMTDTNTDAVFSLSIFYNNKTFGFASPLTNTATLTSNAWNSIIFHRGFGQTLFTGR